MHSFDQYLMQLFKSGHVTLETARHYANNWSRVEMDMHGFAPSARGFPKECGFPDSRSMTILLRDSQTARYYSANQKWCAVALEAMVFDSVEAAAVWAHEQNLSTVQVVMHYEDPKCDLALPLDLCLSYFPGAEKKGQNPRHLG